VSSDKLVFWLGFLSGVVAGGVVALLVLLRAVNNPRTWW